MELKVKKSEFAEFWNLSRSRVSQLKKLGVLIETEDGRFLKARESIENLVLYRHRPRHKPSGNSSMVDLDLSEVLKEFSGGGAK